MSIGLLKGTVLLEPHSIEWGISAQITITKLKNILDNDAVDIQHIGSTSIKSIYAKPIIDIAVGVRDFDDIMRHNKVLKENGIYYRREDHPEQHLYICGDMENNIHTHYIHVVIWGEKAWNDYINMRDYLNTHNEKAIEYSNLKKYLAEKYQNNRVAYTNGKSYLIEKILKSASQWRKNCQQ
ncbi:MAG: GrpB family protein [Ruminococcaceae bacterium]|nr:GrpB family protein [Oscillospiraceae bacterium]